MASRIIFGVGNRIVAANEVVLKFRSFETDFSHNVKLIILSGVISGNIANPRLNILNPGFADNYNVDIDIKPSWVQEQYIVTYILSLKDGGKPCPITDPKGIDDWFFEIRLDITGNGYGYGSNLHYCSVMSSEGLFADSVLFNS